jgi:hypothetical protein
MAFRLGGMLMMLQLFLHLLGKFLLMLQANFQEEKASIIMISTFCMCFTINCTPYNDITHIPNNVAISSEITISL